MLEGFSVHTSNRSQSRPVNKKTSDLGIFNAALALEEGGLFRILVSSATRLADIMDFKELWSNWQLSGLKGASGLLCERLQVWKRLFSRALNKMYGCFQRPLVLPEEGESQGSKDLKSNLLFSIWMPSAFFPQSLCVGGGRLRWHKYSSPHNGRSKRRGRENEAGRMEAWMKEDGLIVNCG